MPETADNVRTSIAPVAASQAASEQRDLYIDRLRTVLTVLVVLHHTAITYGAPGGWFHYELRPSATLTGFLLTLFVSTNQAYFMGFFFLLAGYFTPGSLERKGYAHFLGDRLLRLGVPLLAFIFLLGPLTVGIAATSEKHSFWSTLNWLWQHKEVINGPLWFVQALLIFSFIYCIWRWPFGPPLSSTNSNPRAIPSAVWWILSAFVVGALALGIRQFVPVGVNVFGLQLGYFASYIFLFSLGIVAWRNDWLRQLEWKHARSAIIAAAIALPLLPAAIAVAMKGGGVHGANFSGGFSWPSILYAFWEPFVAWGMIAVWLLMFRTRFNQPSGFWTWLNRRAYLVYIIHPPILVCVSLLLHSWAAPALVKVVVTGTLACSACWLIADPILRLPGARRIV
ncbi:MAG: acyltransferase [Acidobacteriota bacterium]|nr:acyltransferase [Acidobacteriota bacterium]